MFSTDSNELDRLFYPKSIAVIGASPAINPLIMDQGRNYILGSIGQNFKGKIYPVHPKAADTLGFKSYASVLDIPDEIDLAIFTVPASVVIKVMEECVQKKVKFVHMFTAGFSESGREEYSLIEKKMVEMAKKGGVRIIGPNCMGLYCPDGGLSFNLFSHMRPGLQAFFHKAARWPGILC